MTDRSPIPAMLAILTMTGLGFDAGAGQDGRPSAKAGGGRAESGPPDTGPATRDPAEGDPAVGHTLDGPIQCSDLRGFVHGAPPRVRRRQPEEPQERWHRRMVGKLVLSQRLAARGRAEGLDRDPEFLGRWRRTRDRLVLSALEQDSSAGIEVERGEIERYYQEHLERFGNPERITSQLLLLRLPPDAGADAVQAAEARLRGIREEYLAGTPFGELARRHSQAEGAARGGIVASSPRGTLLPEFEEVAWKLKPGEVSEIVRLPDGLALILLNKRLPARQLRLDEVRAKIEKALRRAEARQRRERALAEVCSPWPPAIDGELTDASVLLRLAGEAVRLRDLDIDRNRPHWRAGLVDGLEERCLKRLAAERGIGKRPEIAGQLRHRHMSLLADFVLDRRLEASPLEVAEEHLKALYAQHRHRFKIPERRTFDAAVVAGVEGRLRPARARAQAVARRWRSDPSGEAPCPVPQDPPGGAPGEASDACSVERWGPMPQTELSSLTSPALARTAFALGPDEVSEPRRLERYDPERSRFETAGYVVLRPRSAEPETYRPFEEVRASLLRYAARDGIQQLSDRIRREILLETGLRIDREALSACDLAIPSAGKAPARAAARGTTGR